jgi:hypothetical protein
MWLVKGLKWFRAGKAAGCFVDGKGTLGYVRWKIT